jgi:site-specific DNA-methyltransferase (adenine-specific)
MELMKRTPDKHYDLCIVDPPYGIDAGNMQLGKGKDKLWTKKNWDKHIPQKEYFDELFRVSKKQIVFGGNFFDLPKTNGWIFWDKDRSKDISFSDGELAWTSFLNTIKKKTVLYDGFLGADSYRFHPTQKPIKLYTSLLSNYAKAGDKILDTHVGSASSLIACHQFGFEVVGCELDREYYDLAVDRIRNTTAQMSLF